MERTLILCESSGEQRDLGDSGRMMVNCVLCCKKKSLELFALLFEKIFAIFIDVSKENGYNNKDSD